MRILGVDYGRKRIGLALTDESAAMAFPFEVIKNPGDNGVTADKLAELIVEKCVSVVVIGHSAGLDGKDNPLQIEIEDLIGQLSLRTTAPIHLEPEQYTTQASLRIQGRTDKTDASAAALILESFLSKRKL